MTRMRYLVLAGALLTLFVIVSCAPPAVTETPTVAATAPLATPTLAAVASPTVAAAASPTMEGAEGTTTPTPLAEEATEPAMGAGTETPAP